MTASTDLFRENELARELLDSSSMASLIVDCEGSIAFANGRAAEVFGYTADELAGQRWTRLVPGAHPRASASQPVPRAVDGVPMSNGPEVLQGHRKDDSVFPVAVASQPLRVRGESLVLVNLVDRSELSQEDGAVRPCPADTAFQKLAESLPVGILHADTSPLYFNSAVEAITGYRCGHFLGMDQWFDLLCGETAEIQKFHYQQARDSQFASKFHLDIVRADGAPRLLELIGCRHEQREVWVVLDATMLREAEAKRILAERIAAVRQLVVGLSHKTRNALQRAHGCLDLLELDLKHRPDLMGLTCRVRVALTDLHRDYELVTRYASPIVLKLEPANLIELCESAFDDLVSESTDFPHQLTVSGPRDCAVAEVDRLRMKEVFRQLFENAIAAADTAAQIRINCTRSSVAGREHVQIEVQDNGRGVEEELVHRLFEPFYTTGQQGFGLGLALCQRTVDAHGGKISVSSDSGVGANVVISLPVSAEDSGKTTVR